MALRTRTARERDHPLQFRKVKQSDSAKLLRERSSQVPRDVPWALSPALTCFRSIASEPSRPTCPSCEPSEDVSVPRRQPLRSAVGEAAWPKGSYRPWVRPNRLPVLESARCHAQQRLHFNRAPLFVIVVIGVWRSSWSSAKAAATRRSAGGTGRTSPCQSCHTGPLNFREVLFMEPCWKARSTPARASAETSPLRQSRAASATSK